LANSPCWQINCRRNIYFGDRLQRAFHFGSGLTDDGRAVLYFELSKMEQRPDGGWSKVSLSPPHHGIYRHEHFEIKSQEACSLDGACTSMAEEYFSRLRRAEIGVDHHIAGSYRLGYAQESSWREENRRVPNGDKVNQASSHRSILSTSLANAEGSRRDLPDGPSKPKEIR
jgi:hypothetical protein